MRGSQALDMMGEVSGTSGVEQRALRSAMASAPQAAPEAVAYDAEGRARSVETVQKVGNRAFYRRGDLWIDAGLLDTEPSDAHVIDQFSDAYFDLARQLPPESAVYLTFDEDVLVELDGEAILIRAVKG